MDGGAKNLDEVIHKEDYFYDPFEDSGRFHDTESKIIISEIEENLFKDVDLAGAKITLEINSILKPCLVCQREIARFEKNINFNNRKVSPLCGFLLQKFLKQKNNTSSFDASPT